MSNIYKVAGIGAKGKGVMDEHVPRGLLKLVFPPPGKEFVIYGPASWHYNSSSVSFLKGIHIILTSFRS